MEHSLICPLHVGYTVGGVLVKETELLKSNGISEKVFTDKLPDRVYTWMGNVLTIAIKNIGDVVVGVNARDEFLKSRAITIPKVILDMPLADVNSLMVMIHRAVWQNVIPKQECMCKYCGTTMLVDVDLDRFQLSDEDASRIDQEFTELVCTLKGGWEFAALGKGDTKKYTEYEGTTFNRFVFRIPTLGDAIRNEKFSDDSVIFWRRMALDCLTNIQCIEEDGSISEELPVEAARMVGLKLFDLNLQASDLKVIRKVLRESLPTIPYYYEDECISCRRMTPITMEATSFFSE